MRGEPVLRRAEFIDPERLGDQGDVYSADVEAHDVVTRIPTGKASGHDQGSASTRTALEATATNSPESRGTMSDRARGKTGWIGGDGR